MKRILWTVGHSNRSLAEFLDLLQLYGVELVADVRRWPTSRKFPHFSLTALKNSLRNAGVEIVWLGDLLGGYRKGGYEGYMKTRPFLTGIELLEQRAAFRRTAIMCAELLYFRCHRRFIADVLVHRGWEVVHIVDAHRILQHRSRMAMGGQLTLNLES